MRSGGSRRIIRPRSGIAASETVREKDNEMNKNDIIKRKFSHAFFGYDVTDVDLFLDEVIREFDRLNNELEIERSKTDAALKREDKLEERMALMSKLLEDAGINADTEALFSVDEFEDSPAEKTPEPKPAQADEAVFTEGEPGVNGANESADESADESDAQSNEAAEAAETDEAAEDTEEASNEEGEPDNGKKRKRRRERKK